MTLDQKDSLSTSITARDGQAAYSRYVNPKWVRLLDLLELNAHYVECSREKLRTAGGRTVLDSLSGFRRIHPAMFGQILVMRLYRDHGILTQICGNNFMVLKVAPPLNAAESSLEAFLRAIKEVLEAVHSSKQFWQDALALAGRAIKI